MKYIHIKPVLTVVKQWLFTAAVLAAALVVLPAQAQTTLAQSPMLTLKSAPGLVLLSMGRDLPLYKAAYNDVNDIDGDGYPDLFFKPSFKYEGYFAYDRCYSYSALLTLFYSESSLGTAVTSGTTTYYKCPGKWSGNFLNWVTMSRMDILRKVLYGGMRSSDSTLLSGATLERAFVPQDSTMWGKSYKSVARDGYDIADYTPLSTPSSGTKQHIFANTTLQYYTANASGTLTAVNRSAQYSTSINAPLMIVYQNTTKELWGLITAENLILGKQPNSSALVTSTGSSAITAYAVKVSACSVAISGSYEEGCTGYPSSSPTRYKPTGLLHKYADDSTLAFGLLAGSYDNNYAGGVLRQNIDNFTREYSATNGTFNSTVKGIVHHMNKMRPWGFGESYAPNAYNDWFCGAFEVSPKNGYCMMWGNPLGEIMFEGLNYFAGGSSTPAYTTGVGAADYTYTYEGATRTHRSPETYLDLQRPTWANPYAAAAARTNTAAYPSCAKPVQMTIGDPKTSYDSDQLPGAAYSVTSGFGSGSVGNISGPNGNLNVSTEADVIWASEFGSGVTKNFFIGESTAATAAGSSSGADGNPSAKLVNSFKNIRGHGPDSTTNQGSFYGASVAAFGKLKGLNNPALPTGDSLNVDQISIALDSHIPQIKIPVGTAPNIKYVSIVPLSKSVGDHLISRKIGDFQQTGAITGFYIESLVNTETSNTNAAINSGRPYYKYRISYSDTDQGNDNESDAVVYYEIKVTSTNTLSIGMEYSAASNGIAMHMGYVISGTGAQDGLYLDVGADASFGTVNSATFSYYLDTRPTEGPDKTIKSARYRTGTNPPDGSNIPGPHLPKTTLTSPRTFTVATTAAQGEYVPHDMLWYAAKYGSATKDTSGNLSFKLDKNNDPESYYFVNNPSQLSSKMTDAFDNAKGLAAATASAVASSGTKVVGGDLVYQAGFDSLKWGGELRSFKVQDNGTLEDNAFWKASEQLPAATARNVVLGRTSGTPISINSSSWASLNSTEKAYFSNTQNRFQYLMGVRTNEKTNGGTLRTRTSAPNDTSDAKPTIGDIVNSDPLYIGKSDFGYTDTAYASYKTTSDPKLVGVGSNDGHYRLIDATTGVEKLAYIPSAVVSSMNKLPNASYTHQYYVDGPSGFGHVKYGVTAATWHTVVVSSLGAGGKSIFAIDAEPVSPATSLSTANVLWEYSGASSGNGIYVGNIMNKATIGQLDTGDKGVVILGNGINSINDRATLLVIDAADGTLHRSCTPTDANGNAAGNGLTSVAAVKDTDGQISLVYAADFLGNIWRFNPNDSSGVCSSGAVKVFSAKNSSGTAQAITGELTVLTAPGSKTGNLIVFGTGRYSAANDLSNTDTQTLYGVWDDTNASTGGLLRADLLSYPIKDYDANKLTRIVTAKADVNGGKAWYEDGSYKGWRIDLTCTGASCGAGERFVDRPLIFGTGDTANGVFLTIVPSNDPCRVGGCGWVTGININSGASVATFETDTANSAKICGVTPRGLFISTSTTGAQYLNVTVNTSPRSDSDKAAVFTDSGGITSGSDGSKTTDNTSELNCAILNNCVIPPTTGATGIRRQVWRQLQ